MRRQRTQLCAPWIMSSNAHDYGAVGAALFDIVTSISDAAPSSAP